MTPSSPNFPQTLSPRRTLTLAILFAAAGLVFIFSGSGLWHIFKLSRRVAGLEERIDSLQAVNERMEDRIVRLKSGDLRALEEEARSRGMIKEGEKVFVLKPK